MIVNAGGVKCGEGNFIIIGGPCAVESEEQIMTIAKAVKDCGGDMLRGGAFKPRTSPYDFQGIKDDGIKYLVEAKKATGLPIVTEITGVEYLDLYDEVDVVQVGARNMQNFELLMELGKTKKTVLLKRGMANTLRELLMSAEYILAGGNDNVILCERGIRTFDEETRNTLDLASVPALRKMTDLPIIVDPSHGTGHVLWVAAFPLLQREGWRIDRCHRCAKNLRHTAALSVRRDKARSPLADSLLQEHLNWPATYHRSLSVDFYSPCHCLRRTVR